MVDEEKRVQFLVGLEKLTRETGIIIHGCGCCSSPYLDEADEVELDESAGYGTDGAADVAWIYPSSFGSNWDRYKDTIVKEKK